MPVEVEACAGAHEVAGEHEADEQLFTDGERIELLGGDRHQRAGGADDERRHAGQARGDGVGESVAVERGGDGLDVGRDGVAEVNEGQHNDGVLLRGCGVAGLAKALGEHGEDASGALLFLRCLEVEAALRGQLRDGIAGHADRVELQRLHHRAQAFADVGGGGETGGRLLLQAAEDDGFEFDGKLGDNLAQVGRVGKLEGANGLKLRRVGAVEGVASAGEFVEDQAEREDVGLDGRATGDELLRSHVGDGAAACGVGGLGWRRRAAAGGGGVEVGFVQAELAGEAEVEDLDQAAVGEHDVGGFEVAMEDAELVRGGESVGGLYARGEDELEAGWAFGDDLVEGLAGDVLHDDVRLVLTAGVGGCFAYVIDSADVRVVDGGGEASLAELRSANLLDRQRASFEQLEDDRALQERVRRKVDDARPASADLALKLIVPDCAALHTFDYRKVRAVEGLRYEHPRPNKQPQYHANNSFVR